MHANNSPSAIPRCILCFQDYISLFQAVHSRTFDDYLLPRPVLSLSIIAVPRHQVFCLRTSTRCSPFVSPLASIYPSGVIFLSVKLFLSWHPTVPQSMFNDQLTAELLLTILPNGTFPSQLSLAWFLLPQEKRHSQDNVVSNCRAHHYLSP